MNAEHALLHRTLRALNHAKRFTFPHQADRDDSYKLAADIETVLRIVGIEPYAPPKPEAVKGQPSNALDVEAAMCLWEAVLEWRTCAEGPAARGDKIAPESAAMLAFFEANGFGSVRNSVMMMTQDCDSCWEMLAPARDDHMNSRDQHDELEVFDWEFCPWFVRECVDWETGQVRANWREIATAKFLAKATKE